MDHCRTIKHRPDITFVFPDPDKMNFGYYTGATYITAYLKEKGVKAEHFVRKGFFSLDETATAILEDKPRIVGFTCFDINYCFIKLLARRLKQKRPDIFIALGGPAATFSDLDILKDTRDVDFCVRREGEITAWELISEIKGRRDFRRIKGLTYRKDNELRRNEDRPLIKDKNGGLDILPSPYLSRAVDIGSILEHNGNIPLSTSRGCIFKCRYCNFSSMSNQTIRYHSVGRVLDELRLINRETNIFKNEFVVMFLDDTFTLSKPRIRKLCQGIMDNRINLSYYAHTRPDCLDGETIKRLSKIGFKTINFGLESASLKVLFNMGKARKVSDRDKKENYAKERAYIRKFKNNVSVAKKQGVKVAVSTLFGYPGESLKDGLKTINFLKKLDVAIYQHNFLRVFPGTELYGSLRKKGFGKKSMTEKYPYFKSYEYSEYDIKKIPLQKNEFSRSMGVSVNTFFTERALQGTYGYENPCHYPNDIIFAGKKIGAESVETTAALKTRVMFGENIASLFKNKSSVVTIMTAYSSWLLPLLDDKGLVSCRGIIKSKKHGSKKYVFESLGRLNNKLSEALRQKKLIIGIKTDEDAKMLEKVASSRRLKKGFFNSRDVFILDICRWSSNCPAKEGRRLIYDGTGEARTCFCGAVLSGPDKPEKDLKRRIANLSSKVRRERGCEDCEARTYCSKCMFLGGISASKYCDIMKNRKNIKGFIKMLADIKVSENIIDILKKTY